MDIRTHTAHQYRSIRKILKANSLELVDTPQKHSRNWHFMGLGLIILVVLTLWLFQGCAYSYESINVNKLANAIYKTENSKRWPYGIKHHYKHTSARQACINTIERRLKMWDGHGDFIVWLGLTYSPPLINPNWVRLTKYFYEKG